MSVGIEKVPFFSNLPDCEISDPFYSINIMEKIEKLGPKNRVGNEKVSFKTRFFAKTIDKLYYNWKCLHSVPEKWLGVIKKLKLRDWKLIQF